MKVIAINGSPHTNGNTAAALAVMTQELARHDISTETIHVGGELIHGCIGCGKCFRSDEAKCAFDDDLVNEATAKMRKADGYILGSPTYYGGIAGAMKCFLDRAFYSSYSGRLRHKAATVVAVARRSGGVEVVNQLKHYLTLTDAVIAPSQYWQLVHGAVPGEAERDEEGLEILRSNAEGLVWALRMIQATKESDRVVPPALAPRPRTNFIR